MAANDKGKAVGEVQRPLREARKAQIAAGLQAFHESADEIDHLKEVVDELRRTIADRDAEIAGLKRQIEDQRHHNDVALNNGLSEVAGYRAERDRAVAERAAVEVVLVAIKRVLDLAKLPETVLPDLAKKEGENDDAAAQSA